MSGFGRDLRMSRSLHLGMGISLTRDSMRGSMGILWNGKAWFGTIFLNNDR